VIATETSVTDLYATRVFARVYERLPDAALPDAVAAVCAQRGPVPEVSFTLRGFVAGDGPAAVPIAPVRGVSRVRLVLTAGCGRAYPRSGSGCGVGCSWSAPPAAGCSTPPPSMTPAVGAGQVVDGVVLHEL
jgi:hypothetical protein